MPLPNLLHFQPDGTNYDRTNAVETSSDIPKEFAIFARTENQFLPPGKTWADLTPEELIIARGRYRFDPFKPGIYQSISG